MRTGVLIGWKGAKPEIISSGSHIALQNAEYKKHVIALSKGEGGFDKVELFTDSKSYSKKPSQKKEKEKK
jgi:ribonuclease HI